MASPRLDVRLPERLRQRVDLAAKADGSTTSRWVRKAILEKLGDDDAEARERAEVLAEARRFLAAGPGTTDADLRARRLVEAYARSLEAAARRISEAEQRGRARALVEVANGALVDVDGQELTFGEFSPGGPPVVLEATSPRRRGFLKAALAAERAHALLAAPCPPSPPPSAAGLLGEARTRELWIEATRGSLRPAWGFCRWHGMVPLAETMDGRRQCYLGCSLEGPGVA